MMQLRPFSDPGEISLRRSKCFAQAIDEHFHFPANGAGIDIKGLPVDKEFAEIAKPEAELAGAFMETFGAEESKRGFATRAFQAFSVLKSRRQFGALLLSRDWTAGTGRPALPALIPSVILDAFTAD